VSFLRGTLACAALVPLAACGAGAVRVAAPNPPATIVRMCHTLRDRLPARLRGQPRRDTEPGSPLVTAWGSPAIALRCGVPRPAALRPTSELAVLDGVSWLAQPPDRPVTFTAVGRRAYVEVTVPPKYAPPANVLIDLAAPIKAALPAAPGGSL
jgi:Protein of unknown function (DUF3515)